jgi:hypothetical protein
MGVLLIIGLFVVFSVIAGVAGKMAKDIVKFAL